MHVLLIIEWGFRNIDVKTDSIQTYNKLQYDAGIWRRLASSSTKHYDTGTHSMVAEND